jgi:hypothetical protein
MAGAEFRTNAPEPGRIRARGRLYRCRRVGLRAAVRGNLEYRPGPE